MSLPRPGEGRRLQRPDRRLVPGEEACRSPGDGSASEAVSPARISLLLVNSIRAYGGGEKWALTGQSLVVSHGWFMQ